jgi:hypothetical protein
LETKRKRKNVLNFTELVSFLPFTLNNGNKKILPHGRKRKRKERERERGELLAKSFPAQGPQFRNITNRMFSVRGGGQKKKNLLRYNEGK